MEQRRRSALIILESVAIGLTLGARVGGTAPHPVGARRDAEGNVLTWPPSELGKKFHDLKGIAFAADQSKLPSLLDQVGASIQSLSERLPNIVAHEDVSYYTRTPAGRILTGRLHFEYFILAQREEHSLSFKEYREWTKGTPARRRHLPVEAALTQGFAGMWIVFTPANRGDADFRYLGRERLHGQWTHAIAFVQRPGRPGLSGVFESGGISVPLRCQGIAWFSASDGHMVRMHTDESSAEPSKANLKRLTAQITFGEVRLRGTPGALWLPTEVSVKGEFQGWTYENFHRYSEFRMFHVGSRIMPVEK